MLLFDNDVVFKLAQYDLLDQAVDWLGGGSSIEILDTLQYRFRLHDDDEALRKCSNAEVRDRMRTFIATVGRVPTVDPSDEIARLSQIPGLDSGEVLVLTTAAQRPEDTVFTGDKRAMRALSSSVLAEPIYRRLTGRIVCLEQLIAGLVKRCGIAEVGKKIGGCPNADSAMRAVFAAGEDCQESNTLEGLRSYYLALRQETRDLLAPFEFER